MKRRELAEIKRLFTVANCVVTEIAGWLIGADKECIYDFKMPFYNLEEEMMYKFFDIFKKGLSGRVEKNLYNMEFENVRSELLVNTRIDKLKSEYYQFLFERIAESYQHEGRYAILIAHGVYDIPGKAKDGVEMFDASEEVYDFIMLCICPVALQHPGIRLDESGMGKVEREWVMMYPKTAVVYPAFNEREADEDHVWLYSKGIPDKYLIKEILECKYPETPEEQKQEFASMIADANMEKMKRIYQDILQLSTENDEPITRKQIEKIVGVETLEEDKEIIIQNILNLKRFDIDMPEVSIAVAADYTDLVEEREIDGEPYVLVKKRGDISVNGILLGE